MRSFKEKRTSKEWLADITLENAILEAKEARENGSQQKTRFSLIITLSTSFCSILAVSYLTKREYTILIMASLFLISSILCIIGLRRNRWISESIPPHGIEHAVGKPGELTITQAKMQLALILHDGNEMNITSLTKTRKILQAAYITFGAAPLVALIVSLVTYLWQH